MRRLATVCVLGWPGCKGPVDGLGGFRNAYSPDGAFVFLGGALLFAWMGGGVRLLRVNAFVTVLALAWMRMGDLCARLNSGLRPVSNSVSGMSGGIRFVLRLDGA